MNAKELKIKFMEDLGLAKTQSDLDILATKYVGKKGLVTELMSNIRNVPVEERPTFGADVNETKLLIEQDLKQRSEKLANERINSELSKMDTVDLSEVSTTNMGSLHPVTLVQREIENIFFSMGFTVEADNEVVSDFENFEAVNIPANHPARDMQDTFYLDNGQLLKTQTSAMQNRVLRKYGAPLRAIFPGRCFRNENVDASHDNTFFQIEGLVVDKDISIANIKYFLDMMLSKVLGKTPVTRLRPGYFPFTEPGMELDMQCGICGGTGCPTCKHGGWIEILPCGMVHPRVLEMGGVDPNVYTGFAFGLGLTRLAMMKYGIDNIRELNACNIKVLGQFGTK